MKPSQVSRTVAFLGLLGSFLVFLSFQASSTNLLLVTSEGNTSFCVGPNAFFTMDAKHNVTIGEDCLNSKDAKPTVVANTDSPGLAKVGWLLIVIGFLVQVFLIEPDKITQEDMRLLRKARKILDSK